MRRPGRTARALAGLGMLGLLAGHRRARADEEPVSLVVTGSAAPSFVTRAKEGERPRETTDTASLLEGLPGVRVRRLSGEGGFATVSIRGAASNQVAITLAGVPLTGAADPSLDLATIPLWPGAVVRVHRTFAPAFLGGGYLGGVVQIDPLESGAATRTELYDGASSFGAFRLRLADMRSLSGSGGSGGSGGGGGPGGPGGWRIASGLSATRSDGDFRYYDPARGSDATRANNASAQVAGLVQARFDDGAWTAVVTAIAHDRRDGIGGSVSYPLLFTSLARDREILATEVRHADDDGRWIARAWVRRERRRFDDPRGESFAGGSADDRVLAGGVTIGRSFRLSSAVTVDARMDTDREAENGTRARDPPPELRRLRAGGSVDAMWRASRSLSLILAARADLRRDDSLGGAGTTEVLPVGHLGGEIVVSSAAQWAVSLAAHVGVLARAPSFLELLGDGGVYRPSPDLQSEHGTAVDLGVRARSKTWEAEVVAFATRTRDLMVVRSFGLGSLRAQNVGDAVAAGGEASGAVAHGPLRLLGSYTLLFTEDRTDTATSRGKPLPGRPRHDLTVDASIGLAPFLPLTLRWGLDVLSSVTLTPDATLEIPARSWQTVGAKLAVPGVRGLTVSGEIVDVFDQRTADVLAEALTGARARYPISDAIGYPLPGRRWTLAVRYAPP